MANFWLYLRMRVIKDEPETTPLADMKYLAELPIIAISSNQHRGKDQRDHCFHSYYVVCNTK